MLDHRSSIAALRKTVTVPTSPERAFELFTAFMHEWWPLTTHSIAGDDAAGVVFGQGVGGRIVETMADGTSAVWGTITTWEPPRRVAFTWHPGNPQSEAGTVEVTFTVQSPGVTLVELVHSGWERRSDGAEARSSYDTAWDVVLNAYAVRGGS
jgi:uncharacterized protein YndB with AHSA1/START domain